jgi:phage-related protein
MAWEALFYETQSGRSPAIKFLRSLSKEARSKCSKYIKMFEEHGFGLPSSYLEKVHGSTWALRPEYGGNEYRLFFFDAGNNRFVITHIIHKTSKKIDTNDINTAENRMDDWLIREAAEEEL